MRNGYISTDVFLFSTEEMTYRAFVFTWGFSSKAVLLLSPESRRASSLVHGASPE